MRAVIGCAAVLALAAGFSLAGQAKKEDPKGPDPRKLFGRWEPVQEKDKKDKAAPGPAMVVEFVPDMKTPAEGRVTLTVTTGGREDRAGGTYKLDADKLSVVLKLQDKEVKETLTVKSLTDAELVTVDSQNKTETLRRKK